MDDKLHPIVLYSYSETLRSPDCDCDCACENHFQLSLPDSFNREGFVRTEYAYPMFTYKNWTAIYNPFGPVAICVMNQAGLKLWQESGRTESAVAPTGPLFDAVDALIKTGLIHPPGQVLLPANYKSKTLSAWLHLTNSCNLRCDYCYLNKTSESMDETIAFASLKAIFDSAQKHNYQSVKIKYAGGEPFIVFNLLQKVHSEAKRLKEIYGIDLEETVISNGTFINQASAGFLVEENIRLAISLDGFQDIHDWQRSRINGRGSFAEIWRGLMICQKNKCNPDVTITITNRNARYLEEITEHLLEKGIRFNYNFYRENSYSVLNKDLKINEEEIIVGLKHAYQVIEQNLPDWSLLGTLTDRVSFVAPHSHTCSVGKDYMVIDHHGKIAKCQMEIDAPVTDIYSADPLMDIRNDKLGLQNLSVEEKDECKTCQWKVWCTGGCPFTAYRATGKYDAKSPNCNIYKAIYPELLRLESLRLISMFERGQPN